MIIYYLDELDEPVFFSNQNAKTRHEVEPANGSEYVTLPDKPGKVIPRSRLVASISDPIMPAILMAMLGAFVGWIVQIGRPELNIIPEFSIAGAMLVALYTIIDIFQTLRFNRTP